MRALPRHVHAFASAWMARSMFSTAALSGGSFCVAVSHITRSSISS